ncbi:MAG: GNAT family N-acetyltransferase [Planctomycetota bacterium]|nr:GNAT family N-acetyltransferase [Planctomycetota bacterium]
MPSENIRIRPFEARDQAAVRRLILAGLGEHVGNVDESRNPDVDDILAHYPGEGHVFVVAESGNEIVGSGALKVLGKETGRLVRMSVSRGHRRTGIGRALVADLLDRAGAAGMKQVLVETNKDWADAIGLYAACGFSQYSRDSVSVYLSRQI